MNNKIINIIKAIFLGIIFISFFDLSFAGNENTIKNSIIPIGSDSIGAVDNSSLSLNGNNSLLNSLLKFVKNSIFSLLSIIAIGAFLFVGARLVIARGNPEELKKAIMSFIYAIAGIFIVSIAWGVVKLISSINI